MNEHQLQQIIAQGEGISVEFKTCSNEITPTVYETICAFLNRSGGHIVLGVNDCGRIVGINDNALQPIVKNLINATNNSEILNPTYCLSPEIFDIEDKKVVYIYVPESSEVHRYKGRIYDRVGDADNDISNRHNLIDNIYLRKRKEFTENEVLPFLEIRDLDEATVEKARRLVTFNEPTSTWKNLDTEELLHAAGFWKKDRETGKEGYTLAAALLFGTENTVLNYCPAYRTDAIYRNMTYERFMHPHPNDPDIRYHDRDMICVNLIEAYDRLMRFVNRNLPDKFYLPPVGTQHISLREHLFREIVANMLVHREFASSFPAKFLIFSDRVITENWTKPVGKAITSINDWQTHTKNPMITKIFRMLGHVEELGSGRKNILHFAPLYYPDYDIKIVNDEQFSFAITYQAVNNEGKKGMDSIPLRINESSNDIENRIVQLVEYALSNQIEKRTVNNENETVNSEKRTVHSENETVCSASGPLNAANGPLNGASGPLNAANGPLNAALIQIIKKIRKSSGIDRNAIMNDLGVAKTTMWRYLNMLKAAGIIEYRGSKKTGGYYLTSSAQEILSQNKT